MRRLQATYPCFIEVLANPWGEEGEEIRNKESGIRNEKVKGEEECFFYYCLL
jgi:hypothetical protein